MGKDQRLTSELETEKSDIVERLRAAADANFNTAVWRVLMREAADEIDRLRRERDEARAALRSIAASTCCGACQEAALVAKAALKDAAP